MGRTSDARARLVTSAAEFVYARGYQGVSVEELCERAGVKKGSFYHFFRSKQGLALAALDEQWKLAQEGLVEPAFKNDVPPLDRIGRFFEWVAAASSHEQETTGQVGGCRFGNLSAEMGSRDPAIRAKVESVFQAIAGYFERALEEAVAVGDLSGVDPAANAQALVAYMEGILLLGRTYNDPDLMKRLGRKAVQLACSGHVRDEHRDDLRIEKEANS